MNDKPAFMKCGVNEMDQDIHFEKRIINGSEYDVANIVSLNILVTDCCNSKCLFCIAKTDIKRNQGNGYP